MAVAGGNLHLVWVGDSGGTGEIFYIKATDDGANFGTLVNLSNTPEGISIQPRISVSGNNIAVVWNDNGAGNEEIYFSQSGDGGTTFNGGSPGAPINLSDNSGLSQLPKIATSDSDIFVVWQDFTPDNDDIFYTRSTDGGTTFNGGSPGDPINLSDNEGFSGTPDIAISDTNVYVTWHDETPTNLEIFFISSSDSGDNFGAIKNLSSNSGISVDPRIGASGTNVYVVWQDFTPLNLDVFFKASADSGENFGGPVNLSSDIFDSGFNAELEIVGSDAYVVWPNDGDFGFDVLFRKGSQSAIDIVYDASEYKLTDIAGLTITAPDFNLDDGLPETISVTVTSTFDTVGIEITLDETDVTTGIFTGSHTFTTDPSSTPDLQADIGDTITATFGGQTGTAAIFPRTVSFDNEAYNLSSLSTITVFDQNSNANTGLAETVIVTVTSTSDPLIGISVTLTENGEDTGVFIGSHTFTTGLSSGTALKAAEGDTITASYFDAPDTALIIPGFSPGGSGGGLVINPGFVLDLVGGGYGPISLLFTNGELTTDPDKPIMPSHDPSIDFPLSIDGDGFALRSFSNTISTSTRFVGIPVKVQLIVHDVYEIQHLAFYTNLRGDAREIQDSDTYVIYDKGRPLEIFDPNDIFSDVKINTSKNGTKNVFDFEFTFAKLMEKSDIIVRVWDSIRSSGDTKIFDAWQVIEPPSKNLQNNVNPDKSILQNTEQDKVSQDVLTLIEKWADFSSYSISDSEFLAQFGIEGEHIPSWFKTNARWVVQGDVSEQEFRNGINYLNKIGIIR